MQQGHNIPHKVWRDLFLKAFHGRWRTIYWGAALHGRLISDHAKGGEVSQINFLEIIFHFSNHEGICT